VQLESEEENEIEPAAGWLAADGKYYLFF